MRWTDVRSAFPDQWLVIEALEAHSEGSQRIFDRIAVVEICRDGNTAFQRYRDLHRSLPSREWCPVHTSNEELLITERPWTGVRL